MEVKITIFFTKYVKVTVKKVVDRLTVVLDGRMTSNDGESIAFQYRKSFLNRHSTCLWLCY